MKRIIAFIKPHRLTKTRTASINGLDIAEVESSMLSVRMNICEAHAYGAKKNWAESFVRTTAKPPSFTPDSPPEFLQPFTLH